MTKFAETYVYDDFIKLVPIKHTDAWEVGQRRRDEGDKPFPEGESNQRIGFVYDKTGEENFKLHKVLITGVPN